MIVDTHRRKHLSYLMADHGAIVNPESIRNLPKQVGFQFVIIDCNLKMILLEVFCSTGMSISWVKGQGQNENCRVF